MIEIKNVSKWYGPVQVLNECSTHIHKGEVVVVCGPSGSGKSTLIKTVNGLEPIQKGEIIVNGIKVNDPATDLPKLRSHVGMVFQHFELFPHLSVTENLTIAQVKVLGRNISDTTWWALCAMRSMKISNRGVSGITMSPSPQPSRSRPRPRPRRWHRPRLGRPEPACPTPRTGSRGRSAPRPRAEA